MSKNISGGLFTFCRINIYGLECFRYVFRELLSRICWEKSINGKSINGLLMHTKRVHYGMIRKKCFISYVHILHFMTRSYKCKDHPLMGKYSLVEQRIVIPYDTSEGKNVVTGNLPCLSLFFFLSI